MKKLFFYSVLLWLWMGLSISYAQAPEKWSKEKVTLSDGKVEEYRLYYDAYKEWLNYEDEEGSNQSFHPEDVVSFEYLGSRYYSLPFNSGKLSFFKVEFEGTQTALLSKANSLNLMQYLATTYDKVYRIRGGKSPAEPPQLCEISYSYTNLGSPLFDRDFEPVYLKRCLFIVGGEGLKLYQVEVEKKWFLGLLRYTRRNNINSLETLFDRDNYRKIRAGARKNKLREDRLEDLIKLFTLTEGL